MSNIFSLNGESSALATLKSKSKGKKFLQVTCLNWRWF